jgi:hypothetical protein
MVLPFPALGGGAHAGGGASDGARKRIGRAYGLRERRATETFQPSAYGGVPYLANVIVPLISWPAASAMPRLVRHR